LWPPCVMQVSPTLGSVAPLAKPEGDERVGWVKPQNDSRRAPRSTFAGALVLRPLRRVGADDAMTKERQPFGLPAGGCGFSNAPWLRQCAFYEVVTRSALGNLIYTAASGVSLGARFGSASQVSWEGAALVEGADAAATFLAVTFLLAAGLAVLRFPLARLVALPLRRTGEDLVVFFFRRPDPIAKSSRLAPSLMAAASQRGFRPRPDHVSPFGLRYFAATERPRSLLRRDFPL
jgi:hypothetical protein